jgi:hypothetical protein
MARKLRPDEAEVFNGAMDEAIPTNAEDFLRSLMDKPEDQEDLTLVPGMWINKSPDNPRGS